MRTRIPALILGVTLMMLLALPACKEKPANGGGKEHDPAPTAAEKHAEKDQHADEVTLTAQAITKYGIKVEPVAKHILRSTYLAPARVSFNTENMAHVGSVVLGRVADLRVRVGDTVKKGDVLLVVESAELGEAQSNFLQRRTAAETARPAAEMARSGYGVARQMAKAPSTTNDTPVASTKTTIPPPAAAEPEIFR